MLEIKEVVHEVGVYLHYPSKEQAEQSITHWQLALEFLYARAVPSITGTAAADSVLGRAARNQAFSEFVFTIIFFALKLIGARCCPRS